MRPPTTAGQLLIDDALPEDMRGKNRELNKKGLNEMFQELAERYPEQYRDITHKLTTVSRDAMYTSGGYSFGLKSLLPSRAFAKARPIIQRKAETIALNNSLTPRQKEEAIVKMTSEYADTLPKDVYNEAMASGNAIAKQISSGSKGKPGNLNSLVGGDLLYENYDGKAVPLPVLHSYAEGLTPAEYWAGTYGARKGIVDLKIATRDAGYFSKQLTRAAHRLLVTTEDYPHNPKHGPRGLPVDTIDPDNEGAFLAHETGPYKRNTILTPRIMAHLKSLKHDEILVRSPMVGGPEDGGVASRDVGIREKRAPAPIGDYVGIAAAQAIGEPISQSSIGSKHSGGVAGAGKSVSGFKLIDQLTQVPEVFTGGATAAQRDGKVQRIESAPGGGHYVYIDGERHYVSVDNQVKVKPGDSIEAGDPISTGIVDPSEIVEHKGIGEGRKQFVKLFQAAAEDAGFKLHRRNVELVARGLIDHVKLHEPMGEYTYNDVVPYHVLEHEYQPRAGHRVMAPHAAMNQYLEHPVLHYSIGTKIRPSVVDYMNKFGIKSIPVHQDPPPFENMMVRGKDNLLHDKDWMTKMLGSNLQKGLLQSVHRGATSEEKGTSYVASLSRGVDFGKHSPIKGWNPDELIKSQAKTLPLLS